VYVTFVLVTCPEAELDALIANPYLRHLYHHRASANLRRTLERRPPDFDQSLRLLGHSWHGYYRQHSQPDLRDRWSGHLDRLRPDSKAWAGEHLDPKKCDSDHPAVSSPVHCH